MRGQQQVVQRRLDADEAHAWARVMASVRPLRVPLPLAGEPRGGAVTSPPAGFPSRLRDGPGEELSASGRPGDIPSRNRETSLSSPSRKREGGLAGPSREREPNNTLDGSWDRRLSRGMMSPDVTLDLHGHTLGSAHALLDQGLDRALARGDRLLLLVTGKPPRPESERPHTRGAIRAAVADWLAASRFADRIAAVRGAHPRHGGAGALYIVLRKKA
nr:Smr/MutS family protein [Sphingomonas bacterium]